MSGHPDGTGDTIQPQNGTAEPASGVTVNGSRDIEASKAAPGFYDVAHWYWPYWNDRSKDDTHSHVTVRFLHSTSILKSTHANVFAFRTRPKDAGSIFRNWILDLFRKWSCGWPVRVFS